MNFMHIFYHNGQIPVERKEQKTIAYNFKNPLTQSDLARALVAGDKIYLDIGISYCHKDDQFKKKVGRELAMSRLKEYAFVVKRISRYENHLSFALESEDKMKIQGKIFHDSGKVRVIVIEDPHFSWYEKE